MLFAILQPCFAGWLRHIEWIVVILKEVWPGEQSRKFPVVFKGLDHTCHCKWPARTIANGSGRLKGTYGCMCYRQSSIWDSKSSTFRKNTNHKSFKHYKYSKVNTVNGCFQANSWLDSKTHRGCTILQWQIFTKNIVTFGGSLRLDRVESAANTYYFGKTLGTWTSRPIFNFQYSEELS